MECWQYLSKPGWQIRTQSNGSWALYVSDGKAVHEYIPTIPELLISLGVWATGFFLMTALFKMAVSVKEEILE